MRTKKATLAERYLQLFQKLSFHKDCYNKAVTNDDKTRLMRHILDVETELNTVKSVFIKALAQ